MRCLRTWIAVNTHASAEGGLVHRGRAIAFKHRARQCAGVRRVPDHERAVDDDAGARAGWELVRIGVSCAIFEILWIENHDVSAKSSIKSPRSLSLSASVEPVHANLTKISF